jgi:hypothetical protein
MGLFSPLWMRAIDTFGAPTANRLASAQVAIPADATELPITSGGALR